MRMVINFGGNFWNTFQGMNTNAAFDELLKKPETTLVEVLDNSEVVQELRNCNSKLEDFLCGSGES
jgi:hypothetical protein